MPCPKLDFTVSAYSNSFRSSCNIRPASGRKTETVFVHTDGLPENQEAALTKWLLTRGFHYALISGLVKLNCQSCHSCIPIRIPVAEFQPNRTQKRTRKNFVNVITQIHKAAEQINIAEHYKLYVDHYSKRIFDGHHNTAPPYVFEDFAFAIQQDTVKPDILEFRDRDNKLIAAVAYFLADDGAYGNMHYYDPAYTKQSIGSYVMMTFFDHLKQRDLKYAYLGNWTNENDSNMHYKSKFKPAEILTNNGWKRLENTPDSLRKRPDYYTNQTLQALQRTAPKPQTP